MAEPALAEGSVLDGFTIKSLEKKGGMASLWKVTRAGHKAPMLMKVPAIAKGEDPAMVVGFEMEQMIMPRLKGPHVPRFIAQGDFSRQPYIVMEMLDGTTLLPRLDHLPLPVEEVAEIGSRIAVALDSLHAQRVIHFDVKPSNIMFRKTGEAVLIDYGLARHLDLPDLMNEEFRVPYGTAPYMAPEQIMGMRNDTRSDIFALGVLMYLLVTGTRPFGDPQRLKGLKRRLWRDPVPPSAMRKDVPQWFQEVILRCLEVNAAKRYPTAAQLLMDLRNPSQIQLTARAWKKQQDGILDVLGRRLATPSSLLAPEKQVTSGLANAPIIAVAINLDDPSADLAAALQDTVSRVLHQSAAARVACINVMRAPHATRTPPLTDADGNSHIDRFVRLKDWARTLPMPEARISHHVLEGNDPAQVILDYARTNQVDHIVMGARANSTMRRILGSVAGKVASEAPCTVTVVRTRHDSEE